ncbi:dethiobiotin synthase [Paenalcaligenes hominis]|uniref:dethiobiotin synthase n=1 Tax=Paenalcaligenes hominis TaxID=643674 RepID=UPI003523CCF7
MMTPKAYFITGTDTEIGKTTIAAALLYGAKQHGLSTLACKPVASGSAPTLEGLRNSDALQLMEQCSLNINYHVLNPFTFEPAIAPHLAAAYAGQLIELSSLTTATQRVLSHHAGLTVVEGAGGWHVPINDQHCLSDLALTLQLPVILVVGIRLGCINHALLTAQAIQQQGLTLHSWVANLVPDQDAIAHDTITYLKQRLTAPCLGIVPHLEQLNPAAVISYLDTSLLFNT